MLYQGTPERVLGLDLSVGRLCGTDMHCVSCLFTRAMGVPGDLPRTPVALGFGRVISRDSPAACNHLPGNLAAPPLLADQVTVHCDHWTMRPEQVVTLMELCNRKYPGGAAQAGAGRAKCMPLNFIYHVAPTL